MPLRQLFLSICFWLRCFLFLSSVSFWYLTVESDGFMLILIVFFIMNNILFN